MSKKERNINVKRKNECDMNKERKTVKLEEKRKNATERKKMKVKVSKESDKIQQG